MIQKYLILVDEKSQQDTLVNLKGIFRADGIDLIYKEFNPTKYQTRDKFGNLHFDNEGFKNDVKSLNYFQYADVILSDYNLVTDIINGYEIIQLFRNLNYNKKRKIILYSAQIDTVISDILNTKSTFEEQKNNLINLIDNNIEFIKRDGYLEEVIKTIRKTPDFDFESELIKWFYKRDKDTFNYLFPKYKGRSFKEIAIELESNTHNSIEFKKELIEQIIAYLSNINELKND